MQIERRDHQPRNHTKHTKRTRTSIRANSCDLLDRHCFLRLLAIGLFFMAASFAVNVLAQTPVLSIPAEERYALHPGDVLEIQYRYTPEFNQTVTVQPDGYISLAVGGDLKVGGRTLQQLRNLILAKARLRLESPELTLVLKEFQKPYIMVAGEVNQPGRIELREKLTAIQAVLLAGGMKETAKLWQILIF